MNKLVSIFSFVLVTTLSSLSQNTGNMPYSIYGIGDIYRNGFSFNRGMGGLSTGYRAANYINYMNPASYSAQDSMSFIFDIGGSGKFERISSSTESIGQKVFNVDYLAASFPVTKWWASSFGLVPYSRVGYTFSENRDYESLGDTVTMQTSYSGSGGIYQAYLGNSFVLFKKLSLGFNLSYLFGSINHTRLLKWPGESYSYNTYFNEHNRLGDVMLTYGLQYTAKLNDKHTVVFGAVFENATKIKMNTDSLYYKTLQADNTGLSSNDTIFKSYDNAGKISLPMNVSLGFTYCYDNKITAGFDYVFQDWSKASFPGQSIVLSPGKMIKAGIEITPKPEAIREYYKRIHYRLGFQYSDSYLNLYNHNISDIRLSAGLGLPFKNSKNEFNISAEFGKYGIATDKLLEDRYVIISCSFRFYEAWFYRRKFN